MAKKPAKKATKKSARKPAKKAAKKKTLIVKINGVQLDPSQSKRFAEVLRLKGKISEKEFDEKMLEICKEVALPVVVNMNEKAENKNTDENPEVGQSAEGKTYDFLPVSSIKIEELKTFVLDSQNQLIRVETPEGIAVCPFSGLTDIFHLKIEYYPVTKKAVELKSAKYYLNQYKNVGIYQEGVTKKIFDDYCKVLGHNVVKVTTKYNVRGGHYVECVEKGNISI